MADDDHAENGRADGHHDGQVDAQLVTRLVEQLTRAIHDLAAGQAPPAEHDANRPRRQRVDFGYRALGTLMGRTSRTGKEFDVPTFAARWDEERPVIHLVGLPEVEETVKVIRSVRLEPKRIGPDRAIDSMVGLGGPAGPLLAFGPRLAAEPHVVIE
jgi:hypothetical protein